MWSGPRAVSAVAVVDVSPLYPHLVVLIDDGPEGLQNDPGGERNVTIAGSLRKYIKQERDVPPCPNRIIPLAK